MNGSCFNGRLSEGTRANIVSLLKVSGQKRLAKVHIERLFVARLPWPHTEFIHTDFDRKLNCVLVKRSARSAEHSLACSCFDSGTVSVGYLHSFKFGECFWTPEFGMEKVAFSHVGPQNPQRTQKCDPMGEQMQFAVGQQHSALKKKRERNEFFWVHVQIFCLQLVYLRMSFTKC